MTITARQREMLLSFERDGEATDFDCFAGPVALAWANRERVIEALWRRKLLDEGGITAAGKAALGGKQ